MSSHLSTPDLPSDGQLPLDVILEDEATTGIPRTDNFSEDQWLERRKRYIGGSDSASLFADPRLPSFGKDGIKYGCLRRLVYDKQGRAPDFQRTAEEEENFARGHELESVVAAKFRRENQLGLKVIHSAPHRMSKTHAHAGVNLDYQIVGVTPEQILNLFGDRDAAHGPGYLEIKTANEYVFEQLESGGKLLTDYVFQLQHGLAVKNWQWGIFAVLGYGAGLWRLTWFPVLADRRLGERILERSEEVWAMVEGSVEMPPPLPQPDPEGRCGSCQFRKSCLGEAFVPALPGDGIYHDRPELAELATNYRRLSVIMTKAEKERKVLAKQLLPLLEQNEKFKLPMKVLLGLSENEEPVELIGRRTYYLKSMIDQKALSNEEPEIAAHFTREIPVDFVVVQERGTKEE